MRLTSFTSFGELSGLIIIILHVYVYYARRDN